MNEHLKRGFNELLRLYGKQFSYKRNGVLYVFAAIVQSGSYAAYNFTDGNTAIKILRLKSELLPHLPKEGEIINGKNGEGFLVKQSKRIDDAFTEIEIDAK